MCGRDDASGFTAHNCATGGNCRSDADCGPSTTGYCSPSRDLGACGRGIGAAAWVGWFCHTPRDTCTDDADCYPNGCVYVEASGRWACAC